jgi:hypothetical protein
MVSVLRQLKTKRDVLGGDLVVNEHFWSDQAVFLYVGADGMWDTKIAQS